MIEVYIAHLGLIRDEEVYTRLYNNLNVVRRNKVDRNRNYDDKCRSLLAGNLLRLAVRCHGIDYDKCEFEVLKNGYVGIREQDYFFSISHSLDYCVCAWSNMPVGIDIESIGRFNGRNLNSLARKVLSKDEQLLLNSCRDKARFFAKVWTRKEAYSKLVRKGLAMNFSMIETRNDSNFVSSFETIEGYCLSIAGFEDISKNDIDFKNITEFSEETNA